MAKHLDEQDSAAYRSNHFCDAHNQCAANFGRNQNPKFRRHRLCCSYVPLSKQREIFAMNKLHGNVVGIINFSQIENLADVLMSQLCSQFCFIDKHRDEFFVIQHVWKNSFDCQDFFKSFHAFPFALNNSAIPPAGYFAYKQILPKVDSFSGRNADC